MSDVELPPLPEPGVSIGSSILKSVSVGSQTAPAFGTEVMRAYGRQCYEAGVLAERARCLRVVEMRASEDRTPRDMAFCIGVSIADGYDPDSPAALAVAV